MIMCSFSYFEWLLFFIRKRLGFIPPKQNTGTSLEEIEKELSIDKCNHYHMN